MRSNRRFRQTFISIIVASSLGLSACSDFINGRKQKPEVLNFSNQNLACLKVLPEHIKNFSVGEASDQDIRSAFDCARDALAYFKKNTYGSLPDAYTSDEIRNFFAKYFLKENKVSPELAKELMKIKKALLGGTETSISKEEISHLIDLLEIVKDEAVQLSPHMKVILSLGDKEKISWEQVSAATEQLRFSLQRLLESTQLHHSDYSFEDAKAVLFGLSDFLQGSKPFVPYENLKKWLPLIESVKNVLMGRHAQLIRMNQWKESLNSVIDLHGLVLKYRYVIQNLDFSQRQDVRQMSQFANQALTLIENSQQIKMAGMIPKEDIDELIHQLLPFMHFDFTLREISVKKLYRVVLLRMLSPERGDGFEKDTRGFMGLTKENLEALRREFNIWRMGQSFADSVKLNDSQKIAQKTLLESYDKFNINYVISQGLTKDALEETALKNSWRDFGDLLKSPILVNFNKKGRLIEATNPTLYDVSWKSLTKMNLMRSLARMLTLGYGDKTANRLSDSGINKPGLISWYDDFNEFGLDVKAFDPRTGNAGSRSFLEANFFTFSGNGDDRMDQRETFEFVSVLISAGLGTSDEVRKDMKVCEALEVKADVFGYNYLHEECFKKRFRENAMYYLDNMPRMVAYIKNLSDPDYEAFYNHLKTAAETIDQKQDLIETANIRTMITVLHYVESVMVTYDADKNQTLSLSEIYAAAPRFMSFLKTIKSVKYDFIAKEGFAYLVLTGEVPRDGWRGAWDLAKFQTVKNGLPEADRKDILALFGTLKQELNKKPN